MDPTLDKNHFTNDVESHIDRIFSGDNDTEDSIVKSVENRICNDLEEILRTKNGSSVVSFEKLQQKFVDYSLPEKPTHIADHFEDILENLIPSAVNTCSPHFVGHMTSALPRFMLPLAKIMVKLNQNVVKVETSQVFTPLEKQLVCQLHNLIYANEHSFYEEVLAQKDACVGSFCSGGTIANLTALWYARNAKFSDSVEQDLQKVGLFQSMLLRGYRGLAILVSEKAHYSLRKAADVLGLGADFLISIPVDVNSKVKIDLVDKKCQELLAQNIGIVAIVGIAGTTETGNIDDLNGLADIAAKYHCHFHVDAAWGGATLFSRKYRCLLTGIARADSVTIDAHKQMYTPIGVGMAIFKQPLQSHLIQYNAEYIIRRGSGDLGRHSLEGSRPAMSLFLYSSLRILGLQGYEILINRSIEKAKAFAKLIAKTADFELVTEPELCILTYRYVPARVKLFLADCGTEESYEVNEMLNQLTILIQERMKELARAFVSRTSLTNTRYKMQKICVFRVVLANPLTSHENLLEIITEQRLIAHSFVEDLRGLDKSIERKNWVVEQVS